MFFQVFFLLLFFQPFILFRSDNLYHFKLMLKVDRIQEESGLERGGGVFFFFMNIVL